MIIANLRDPFILSMLCVPFRARNWWQRLILVSSISFRYTRIGRRRRQGIWSLPIRQAMDIVSINKQELLKIRKKLFKLLCSGMKPSLTIDDVRQSDWHSFLAASQFMAAIAPVIKLAAIIVNVMPKNFIFRNKKDWTLFLWWLKWEGVNFRK